MIQTKKNNKLTFFQVQQYCQPGVDCTERAPRIKTQMRPRSPAPIHVELIECSHSFSGKII